MKNMNGLFPFSSFVIFVISSCSLSGQSQNIRNYYSDLSFHNNFKVMQLSDMHFSSYDDLNEDFRFLDLSINEASPDLIVITGDSFTFASKATVDAVLNYFENLNIPWTLTFGNHDEQVYVSSSYISQKLDSFPNCLYRFYDDNLNGQGNNIINLKTGDLVNYQIFIVDSNAYTYEKGMSYDYVHEEQIEWYKSAIVDVNKTRYGSSWKIGDNAINSIVFEHIPVPEYADAIEAYKKDPSIGKGWNREKASAPTYNSGFFDAMKEYNSTKAMFVGHDHINNFDILYQGIHLCYGAKSTDNMYHDDDMLGYCLISIEDETSFKSEVIYHSYGEIK